MTTLEPCVHYDIIGDLLPGQAKDMATCKFCRRQRKYILVFLDTEYRENYRVYRPGYFAPEREIAGYVADSMRRRGV